MIDNDLSTTVIIITTLPCPRVKVINQIPLFSCLGLCQTQNFSFETLHNPVPRVGKSCPSLHMVSVCALLKALPNTRAIAYCHLTHLPHLISCASKGHYGKNKAVGIRNIDSVSIDSFSKVTLLELQQTISLIEMMGNQITQAKIQINPIVGSSHSPVMTSPVFPTT